MPPMPTSLLPPIPAPFCSGYYNTAVSSTRQIDTRSTARGDATREAILEAAVELLRERGFGGLRIAQICERADIAPPSLYWHFGSKAGLMESVVARVGGDHVERIRAAVATAHGGIADRLDALVTGMRDLVTTQPFGSLTSIALASEGPRVTPELQRALKDARRAELGLVTAEIEAHLGEHASHAGAIATLIISAANYAALVYRIDHDAAELDRILGALREAILILSATP